MCCQQRVPACGLHGAHKGQSVERTEHERCSATRRHQLQTHPTRNEWAAKLLYSSLGRQHIAQIVRERPKGH